MLTRMWRLRYPASRRARRIDGPKDRKVNARNPQARRHRAHMCTKGARASIATSNEQRATSNEQPASTAGRAARSAGASRSAHVRCGRSGTSQPPPLRGLLRCTARTLTRPAWHPQQRRCGKSRSSPWCVWGVWGGHWGSERRNLDLGSVDVKSTERSVREAGGPTFPPVGTPLRPAPPLPNGCKKKLGRCAEIFPIPSQTNFAPL